MLEIEYFGHSCFKVSEDDYSVVIDPYHDGSVPGYQPLNLSGNEVLCSHEHGDHNAREIVKITKDVIKNPFTITTLNSFHDESLGSERGNNIIHILNDGKNRIVHLGDLGCMLEDNQIDDLKDVDVLMIPIGGYYTIDSIMANSIIDKLKPRIIIPMHYRGDDFGYDVIDTNDNFLKKYNDIKYVNSKIIITDDLKDVVVVMDAKA